MGSLTTVVKTLFKQQKIMLCWVLNPQQRVARVTPGQSETVSEDHWHFQHENQSYALRSCLGLCQTLGIRQMVWSLQKGRAKVTQLWTISWSWSSVTPSCDTGKMKKPPNGLFLGRCPQKSQNCSRFSNKYQSHDANHLASDEHHQVCKNL